MLKKITLKRQKEKSKINRDFALGNFSRQQITEEKVLAKSTVSSKDIVKKSGGSSQITLSNEKSGLKQGQVILEFTFCMIVLFFMIYGVIMVFRWTGVDLAERRRAHTRILTQGVDKNWHDLQDGPMAQIKPYFFGIEPMNATQSPY